MASFIGFQALPFFMSNPKSKCGSQVQVRSLSGADSTVLSSDSVVVNGTCIGGERRRGGTSIDQANGQLRSKVEEKRRVEDDALETLKPLWDDGYGTETIKDYFDLAKDIVKPDGGPPRWFSPIACGCPLKDSPVLLFLPGMDGTGLGLVLHHTALGKAFEVWCLHIPVHDRTPFEGLVKLVEETVRFEHASSPHKPIYLVGDNFGGCLALAVASRNPAIDLVLILSNPATSFGRSQLQPLFLLLEAMPDGLHSAVPYLSSIVGDLVKMAAANIESMLPPEQRFERLSGLLPYLSLLPIKKLDTTVSGQQRDEDFFELVSSISKLRHANIVELVGYCAEHGQRLLVYEYCRNGTLHDALHDDEIQKNLSWKTHIQAALEAARALEYLHEICQPPIVHRNFKSANLLLDDKLELCVSDCGLAPLLSSSSASQHH